MAPLHLNLSPIAGVPSAIISADASAVAAAAAIAASSIIASTSGGGASFFTGGGVRLPLALLPVRTDFSGVIGQLMPRGLHWPVGEDARCRSC